MAVMNAIGSSAESFDKSYPRQQEAFSCPGAILKSISLLPHHFTNLHYFQCYYITTKNKMCQKNRGWKPVSD